MKNIKSWNGKNKLCYFVHIKYGTSFLDSRENFVDFKPWNWEGKKNVKLILGSEPKKIATFFPAVEAHCFEPIARAPNNFGSAHPSSKNRLGEWRLTLDAP